MNKKIMAIAIAILLSSTGVTIALAQKGYEYENTGFEWFESEWNTSSKGGDGDFIYIGEEGAFNPNPPDSWIDELEDLLEQFPRIKHLKGIILGAWNHIEMFMYNLTMPNCKGLIKYDFNDNTYNMQGWNFIALPLIFINGSIGKPIDAIPTDFNVSFWINQSWTDNVVSYNVIGQINGTDPTKTVIIGCLYDSWWSQGTADAAIGMAMVLGIAKYFKDYNITPKCNVKFIAYGGEEHGYRGADYYEILNRKNEYIPYMIDLNQIGFTPLRPDNIKLQIWTNNQTLNQTIGRFAEETNYTKRN